MGDVIRLVTISFEQINNMISTASLETLLGDGDLLHNPGDFDQVSAVVLPDYQLKHRNGHQQLALLGTADCRR